MKKLIIMFILGAVLLSCKDDEPSTTKTTNYTKVNEWIYNTMSLYYYWNATLPSYSATKTSPTAYFTSLKYKDDRFSAIFENYDEIQNALNGVNVSDVGFEFQLYLESSTGNNVVGIIFYLKPGTPIIKSGLKRGDMFRKINGVQLTTSNYNTLLNAFTDNSRSVNVTFADYENNTFIDVPQITITKAMNYQENPVLMDSIYTVQNKKVGYLVYNFFANDPGDNSFSYDLKLNEVIANFKQNNVTELVLDLRYNHGGMMTSATHLASMLVPNLSASQPFVYIQYNSNLTNYFNSSQFKSSNSWDPFVTNFTTTIDVTEQNKVPVQNIGNNLQHIYFLTGTGTASASEMVINGLKPFMTCTLIGDTTVGKNVGSYLLNDLDNVSNKWAIMPIALKYFNKDHKSDFASGFVPDYYIRESLFLNLGDTNELLLNKALSLIAGNSLSVKSSIKGKQVPLRTFAKKNKPFKDVMIDDRISSIPIR